MSNQVYCKAPWVSISYMPGGKYSPCCSWHGELFDSPDQVLEQVGGAFLQGEVPEPCQRSCPSTGPGWRHAFTQYATDYKSQQIQMLDFRNNNLCNLKCRSCSPAFSTSWAAEYGNEKLHLHQPADLPAIDLSLVKEIYFAGGEPLLNPQHYELLELLLKKGIRPRLMYSTNMTVLQYKNKSVKELWPQFSKITVSCSLDAVGPYLEFVRSGSDWSVVQQNLDWMKSQPNVQMMYSPVISAINIWWIDHLFDYLKNTSSQQFTPVLANPDGREGLLMIPAQYRPLLIDKLKQAPFKNQNVQRAIELLESSQQTNYWWEFVSQQLILDNYRTEHWFDHFPMKDQLYKQAYHYYG